MPTIRINGTGGAGGGIGGGGPGGLNELWEKLLANPNMATQREFLMRLNMLLPNNLFHGGAGLGPGITYAMQRNVGQILGAAAGGGAGLQAAGGALTAAAAALVGAANRIAGAAGGGGRGAGGAAAAAGVFGRGLPGPFRRAGRFGAAIGGLSSLFGLGALGEFLGPIGIAAGLGYEALRLPTHIGNIEGSFAGEARPYTDLVKRLYAVGRAGNVRGGALVKQFFPGEDFGKSYQTPDWMSTLGLTPDATAQILERYGIMPRSAGGARRIAEELRKGALAPGFAGMAPGTVEGLARQAAGLGLGVQRHPDFFLAMVARNMEDAVAKGMDRASVLRSIQQSMSRFVGGSAGFGAQSLLDFYQRMSSTNLPGARTGQLQAQALAGESQAISNIGRNPVTTMMVARAIAAHGGLTTNKQIASFFGPELYGQLTATAPGRAMLKGIRSLGAAGLTGPQMAYVKAILAGNPQLFAGVLRGTMGNFSSNPAVNRALQTLAMSNVTGEGLPGYLADTLGKQPGDVMGQRTLGFLQQLKGASSVFSPQNDYAAQLAAAGVPKELIPGLVIAGQKYNINPMMLAAQIKAESGFKNAKITNKNGTVDYGYAQINSATLKRWGISSKYAMNPVTAPLLEARALHEAGGDILSMVQGYNPKNPNEVPRFLRAYGQLTDTNLPEDIFRMESSVGQAQTTGAYTSFEAFGNNIAKANEGLSKFAGLLHTIVSGLSGSVPKTAPAMPQGGGPL